MSEETLVTAAEEVAETPSGETLVTTDTPVTEVSEETQEKADPQTDAKPEGAPENYEDFTFPEDVHVSEELVGGFAALAKELNLTQENAQKVIDLHNKATLDQMGAFEKVTQEWADTTRNDPDLGGANLDANLAIAKKPLEFFGNEELRSVIDQVGIGNNPEFIRFLHGIGTKMDEASFHQPGAKIEPPKTVANILFPDMN